MNYKYNKNGLVINSPLVIKNSEGYINTKFDSELGSCKWLKGNPVKIGGYSRSCKFVAAKQLMQKVHWSNLGRTHPRRTSQKTCL